ncbi:hypothetical protein TcCL_Unassigned02936 [Trypanosoma cruzi]|nr:hypothetical protein TcCL_Unassigned02936 [Trypanosoma cruzi]
MHKRAVTHHGKRKKRHTATASISITLQTVYAHGLAENTQSSQSQQLPKELRAQADPYPPMKRCLIPRGRTKCITSTEKETRGVHSLSSFPLTSTEGSGSCTQLPAPSTKEASTCTAMCVSCACGCVRPLPRSTRKEKRNEKKEKRRKASEGTHKHKFTAGVHGAKQRQIKQHSF